MADLLRRLKMEGHRVLIFTQMSKMLDILESFLNIHGFVYLRLDGSTKPEQRQIMMQRFNTDSKIFAFILSTRSGGVGINLTGADTVIFYDSDWNPAMDKQAQDRCHRIGQTREVNIYRLVSEHTIEENILKKSDQKRHLDHLAIQSGTFNADFLSMLGEQGGGGMLSTEEMKAALRDAEDADDVEAADRLQEECEAELREFEGEGGQDADKEETEENVTNNNSNENNDQEHGQNTQLQTASQSTDLPANTEQQEEDDTSLLDVTNLANEGKVAVALEQLDNMLKPIDKYAVKQLDEIDPPVNIEEAAQEAVLNSTAGQQQWDVQELEAIKFQMEIEMEEDEELRLVDEWETEKAKEIYEDQLIAVRRQWEERERQWLLQYQKWVEKQQLEKEKEERRKKQAEEMAAKKLEKEKEEQLKQQELQEQLLAKEQKELQTKDLEQQKQEKQKHLQQALRVVDTVIKEEQEIKKMELARKLDSGHNHNVSNNVVNSVENTENVSVENDDLQGDDNYPCESSKPYDNGLVDQKEDVPKFCIPYHPLEDLLISSLVLQCLKKQHSSSRIVGQDFWDSLERTYRKGYVTEAICVVLPNNSVPKRKSAECRKRYAELISSILGIQQPDLSRLLDLQHDFISYRYSDYLQKRCLKGFNDVYTNACLIMNSNNQMRSALELITHQVGQSQFFNSRNSASDSNDGVVDGILLRATVEVSQMILLKLVNFVGRQMAGQFIQKVDNLMGNNVNQSRGQQQLRQENQQYN